MSLLLPLGDTAGPIPRILHFVWVGSTPPLWVSAAIERWRARLPHTWAVRVWTDAEVSRLPALASVAALADLYGQPPRGKANLLRIAITSLMGGVYCDTDTALVDPAGFDALASPHRARTPWIGGYAQNEGKVVLDNSCFGMPAHHPMLGDLLVHAEKQLRRGIVHTHHVSGPRAWYACQQAGGYDVETHFVWGPKQPAVSRAFYRDPVPDDVLPQADLERLSGGFPVAHVSPMTAEDRGYASAGGGQQVVSR